MDEHDKSPVRVGLLDTGVSDAGLPIDASTAFGIEDGEVREVSMDPSDTVHGTALAATIVSQAPGVIIVSAQVFRGGRPGSAAVVAAGLDWLVSQGAQLVNMSFGLRHDRAVLRGACEGALASGVVLVASAPASGHSVYPAAYRGMVRVTGDARCAPGELSWLGGEHVDFGACVGGPDHRPHQPGAGASLAAAHFSGALARELANDRSATRAIERLRRACRYRGRERRGTPAGPA